MHITDKEGKKITITDLQEALEQAELFKAFRHINADPLQVASDDERAQYWTDLHEKLLKLQTEIDKKINR